MEEEFEYRSNIIIDNDSGYCKAGFSDEEVPRTVFPTVVSWPMNKEFYIGCQVYDKINQIMKYPIEHSMIRVIWKKFIIIYLPHN